MKKEHRHPMYDVYDSVSSVTIAMAIDDKDDKEKVFLVKEDGDDYRVGKARPEGSYDSHTKMNYYSFSFDVDDIPGDPRCYAQEVERRVEETGLARRVRCNVHADDVNVNIHCPRDIRESDIPDGLYAAEARIVIGDIVNKKQ